MGRVGAVGNEYAFQVWGRISPDITAALQPLRAAFRPPKTELRGIVVDHAALQSIIVRLEQLGLKLVALQRLPDGQIAAASPHSFGTPSPDAASAWGPIIDDRSGC